MAARSQFEPLREAAWYQYCRIALRPTARIPNLHACMRSLMCAAGQGVRLSITQTVPTALSAVGITHWCPLAGAPPATTVHRPCGANQIVARSRRNNPNRCTRLSVNEKGEGLFRGDLSRSSSVAARPEAELHPRVDSDVRASAPPGQGTSVRTMLDGLP